MTLEALRIQLETSGMRVAYEHFDVNDVPTMPFVCYAETGSNNFAADGKVYEPVKVVEVQLFSKIKDLTAEANLEASMSNLFWTKESEWNEDELCYRVIYTVQI